MEVALFAICIALLLAAAITLILRIQGIFRVEELLVDQKLGNLAELT